MVTVKGKLFRDLADGHVVIPALERALFSNEWPDSYNIKVDLGRHTPPPPGEIGWFYPSSHCLMDKRRLYYEIHPEHRLVLPEEKFPLSSIMSMTMGIAYHAIVQTQLQMAGRIVSEEDIEVRFRNEERRCRGRLDFLFTRSDGTKIPVELKTQNSRAFVRYQDMLPYWECQLQVTMDGLGYEEGIIFVVEMGQPWQMKEFRVRRDEELLNTIYEKWATVLEHVKANTPPRHCCEKGSSEMDKCRAKSVCWLAENSVR
ncbi:MAG TPA: hypothetical protein VIY48_15130 [Candidatus Paceibacterota bacterium]